jgi:hypothetical protein
MGMSSMWPVAPHHLQPITPDLARLLKHTSTRNLQLLNQCWQTCIRVGMPIAMQIRSNPAAAVAITTAVVEAGAASGVSLAYTTVLGVALWEIGVGVLIILVVIALFYWAWEIEKNKWRRAGYKISEAEIRRMDTRFAAIMTDPMYGPVSAFRKRELPPGVTLPQAV